MANAVIQAPSHELGGEDHDDQRRRSWCPPRSALIAKAASPSRCPSLRQCLTMPIWLIEKVRKAPMAKSGMSRSVMPPNRISSPLAREGSALGCRPKDVALRSATAEGNGGRSRLGDDSPA